MFLQILCDIPLLSSKGYWHLICIYKSDAMSSGLSHEFCSMLIIFGFTILNLWDCSLVIRVKKKSLRNLDNLKECYLLQWRKNSKGEKTQNTHTQNPTSPPQHAPSPLPLPRITTKDFFFPFLYFSFWTTQIPLLSEEFCALYCDKVCRFWWGTTPNVKT